MSARAICPVCGLSLLQSGIEDHVQLCLDKGDVYEDSTVKNVVGLWLAHRDSVSHRVTVCTEVDQFLSKQDRGWGCGWRNLQQFLSSLQRNPAIAARLGWNGGVPSVSAFQLLLESAYRDGFDPEGAALAARPRRNPNWVGSAEIATVLRSRGVMAHIRAFPRPGGCAELERKSPSGSLRVGDDLYRNVACFVIDYFERYGAVSQFYSGTRVRDVVKRQRNQKTLFETLGQAEPTTERSVPYPEQPFVPCLYLQFKGHSQTVFGYQICPKGLVQLLILDPGHNGLADKIRKGHLRGMLRPENALNRDQYEIVFVRPTDPFVTADAKILVGTLNP